MSQSTISPELAQKFKEYQQTVTREPDGPGKRVGQVGEVTVIAPLKPGGAEKFRQNLETYQAHAGYYETSVGTVHDFRVAFFDNDTRVVLAVTYDGDLKPYLVDIFSKAGPWFDEMFSDVLEGYPGSNAPNIAEWVLQYQVEADLWFASNPDMTAKDIAKAGKMMNAFETLLDAASS
ncbi:MAG: hypothetical protein JOZ71_03365 [Ktedonobacteraceae bacterium]|nr:hypothetical protein [Ktedonobacteraceae bacterium]